MRWWTYSALSASVMQLLRGSAPGGGEGTHRVDRVRLGGGLVVAVAQYAREPQRESAGIPRRCLQPVERDLDDLFGTQSHFVTVHRTVGQFGEALGLPVEHR